MTEENKEPVAVAGEKVAGEEGTAQPEKKEGKETSHPESVPWTQYIGVKEKLNKMDEKVRQLTEQVANAPNAEEHTRIKGELEAANAELGKLKERSASEKRATLVQKGMPEDKVKAMSDEQLNTALEVLGALPPGGTKTRPDTGSGGGGQVIVGSPQELAVRAYQK